MPNKGLGQLERLTVGERALIQRRRRGENQRRAAERHGLSIFIYGRLERDNPPRWLMIVPIKIDKLTPAERCLLYRRRAGYTQARVAKELGVCRWWLNQMERGAVACDDLLWYWEA